MIESCDDCYDIELEDILADEQDDLIDENPDAWRQEIDQAIAEVRGDLYALNPDAYLEEIEKAWDEFRPKPEIPDIPDPEADQQAIKDAIAAEQESGRRGGSQRATAPRNRVP